MALMTSPNTRNLIGQDGRLPRGYQSFKELSAHAHRCRASYEQERRAVLTSAFESLRLEKPTLWLSPWNIALRGYRGEYGAARLELHVQVVRFRANQFAELLENEGIRFRRSYGRFRIRQELDIARVLSAMGCLRKSFIEFVRRRGGKRERILKARDACLRDYRVFFEAAGRVADDEEE